MPNAKRRANARILPDDEPRYRIAHLIRDPALRKAIEIAEDDLGTIPMLPEDASPGSGSDDARSIFRRALFQAELACARQVLRHTAGVMKREEMLRFAGVPAMTREQMASKKRILGSWCRTDKVFSEAIARDEVYLKTKAAAQREAAQ